MDDSRDVRVEDRRDSSAAWLGWIGIIAGIMAFFYAPLLFGGAAIILGLITAFSRANGLGWWSIALGVVAIVFQWFYHGTFY